MGERRRPNPQWHTDGTPQTHAPGAQSFQIVSVAARAAGLREPGIGAVAPERRGLERQGGEWAIQDSNLGPLPYQRSALTD